MKLLYLSKLIILLKIRKWNRFLKRGLLLIISLSHLEAKQVKDLKSKIKQIINNLPNKNHNHNNLESKQKKSNKYHHNKHKLNLSHSQFLQVKAMRSQRDALRKILMTLTIWRIWHVFLTSKRKLQRFKLLWISAFKKVRGLPIQWRKSSLNYLNKKL